MAAPATFSHMASHDALKSTSSVPGPARQLKLYQLRGTRTSQRQPKQQVVEGDSEYKCIDPDDVDAAAAEILNESDPWYVQDVQSILAVEKIRLRQQKLQKEAEEARLREQEQKRAAEQALLEAQQRKALQRQSAAAGAAALTAAEARRSRVADIVQVRKLRTRDVETAIAEVDVQLQSTAKRYIRSRRCVRQSVELLGLKEQELRLARERSLRLYAAASATLVQQGVAEGHIKSDKDLDLYQSSGMGDSRRARMASIKTIRAADEVYSRYQRIEYLWNRLRYHARVVGRAVLEGRTFDYKRRLSSYNALADVVVLTQSALHLARAPGPDSAAGAAPAVEAGSLEEEEEQQQRNKGQVEGDEGEEDVPPPPPPEPNG
jgi:hypothetical protein